MAVLPVVDPIVLDGCLRRAYANALNEIPRVTGNLRERSKKIERVGAVDFVTFFDVKKAPYAEWVNLYSPKSAGWFLTFQKRYKEEIEIELRKVGYIV
jgi:hypothetical protein